MSVSGLQLELKIYFLARNKVIQIPDGLKRHFQEFSPRKIFQEKVLEMTL